MRRLDNARLIRAPHGPELSARPWLTEAPLRMVSVADGTPGAAARLARVLWNDPATGVMRHADAGYGDALACARANWACLAS